MQHHKHYDFLIVGSGLFGATFAYMAGKAGRKCLVVEKRDHTGGNVRCETIQGITVHKYGAHIFHTSNRKVWDLVNSLVPFNRFTNSPIANYRGELYNLPFNMNTFHRMWGVVTPQQARDEIERQKADVIASLGGREPSNLEEQALSMVGRDIYVKLIREYTEKQWGRSCKDLPASIIKRIPVRFTYDNNYFNDRYQGIPEGGYNRLTDALLAEADVITGTDFFNSEYADWRSYADRLVYTGPLDEYFGYRFGRLEWRTVELRTRVENVPDFQGNAVVNYTSSDKAYTRIIEHKHFDMSPDEVSHCPVTVISEEYPAEYREGSEPYYPINDKCNNELAGRYRELAAAEKGVLFGGRLAQYRYYDMAPVIEEVLKLFPAVL